MTITLEFSVMADSAANLQPLLDQFESEQNVRVRLRLLSWDTAWSDIIRVALYGDGPDVSEIGSTWLGDLIAMNALYPFRIGDLIALGGSRTFLPTAYEGLCLPDQPEVWAIPWLTGARLVFYRRDMLQTAGIDERTAFLSPRHLEQTLAQLQSSGVAVPWTIPTGVTHSTLLNVATWVWGCGGDFLSPDGRQTMFGRPNAIAGFRAYFALRRFLAPAVQRLSGLEPDAQFLNDSNTAITLSGSWLFDQASPELKEQMGVALPPGPSFIGGSHLVVWNHTRYAEPAVRLIRFLLTTLAQVSYSQRVGLLPATLDALSAPLYTTDPLWQIAVDGLKTGRTFPVARSWGLIEDRLTNELAELWDDVLRDPDSDPDAAISRRLIPLANRLDLALGQT